MASRKAISSPPPPFFLSLAMVWHPLAKKNSVSEASPSHGRPLCWWRTEEGAGTRACAVRRFGGGACPGREFLLDSLHGLLLSDICVTDTDGECDPIPDAVEHRLSDGQHHQVGTDDYKFTALLCRRRSVFR